MGKENSEHVSKEPCWKQSGTVHLMSVQFSRKTPEGNFYSRQKKTINKGLKGSMGLWKNSFVGQACTVV